MHLHDESSFAIFGSPYGTQAATGGSPPGQYGQQMAGPQASSWLFRNQTGPSFHPPAPAEAAADWANHASLASAKAENVLLDIEKIRADAVAEVSRLSSEADQVLAKVQSISAKTIGDLQSESDRVMLSYAAGRAAVEHMFKEAAAQTAAANQLAVSAVKTAGIGGGHHRHHSFAQIGQSSVNAHEQVGFHRDEHHHHHHGRESSHAQIGEHEQIGFHEERHNHHHHHSSQAQIGEHEEHKSSSALQDSSFGLLGKQQTDKATGEANDDATTTEDGNGEGAGDSSMAPSGGADSGDTDPSGGSASAKDDHSAATGNPELDAVMTQIQQYDDVPLVVNYFRKLAQINGQPVVTAPIPRSDELLHNTTATITAALKAAKDLADKMNVREFEVERQLLELLGKAQQSELKAAQIAGRAEIVAARAVQYAQKMSQLAQYSQNAAGQAAAAQMAQAMGFPIAARGVPSPLPPPDIDAQIPAPYVPGMPLQSMSQRPGMFARSTAYQPSYAGSGIPGNVSQYSLGGSFALFLMSRETRMQNLALFF